MLRGWFVFLALSSFSTASFPTETASSYAERFTRCIEKSTQPRDDSIRPDFESCIKLLEANPDHRSAAHCFYDIARNQGRSFEAIEHLERYLEIFPDRPWLHDAMANTLALRRERYADIEQHYRTADSLLALGGNDSERADILLRLISTYRKLQRNEEARQNLRLVEILTERSNDASLRGRFLLEKARFKRELDADLVAALDLLAELENSFDSGLIDHARLRLQMYSTLSSTYYDLNHTELSRKYRIRQIDQALEMDDCRTVANAFYNLEALDLFVKEPSEENRSDAVVDLKFALSAAQRARKPKEEANLYHLLGLITDGIEALQFLEECLAMAERISDTSLASKCHARLGRLLLAESPEQAASELKRSFMSMKGTGPWADLYGWEDRLSLAEALWPEPDVREFQERILTSFENLRTTQSRPGDRAGITAAWLKINDHISGRLLTSITGLSGLDSELSQTSVLYRPDHQLERAFRLTERRRARVLLERLGSKDSTFSQAKGTFESHHLAERQELSQILQDQVILHFFLGSSSLLPTTEAERFELLQDLGFDETTAEKTAKDPQSDRTRSLLQQTKKVLAHRKAELETHLAEKVPVRFSDTFPSLAEVMEALAPDEALLLYQLGYWQNLYGDFDTGSWLLSVTSSGVSIYALRDLGEVEDRVTTLIGLDQEPDLVAPASLARLHDDLLKRALLDLPPDVDRLTIVPDGELHNLPFDALRPFQVALPLAHRYQISIAPSATLWFKWRHEPWPADTLWSADTRRTLVLAPLSGPSKHFLQRFFAETAGVMNLVNPVLQLERLAAPPPWRDLSAILFPTRTRGPEPSETFLVDQQDFAESNLGLLPWLQQPTRSFRNSLFEPLPGTRQEAENIRQLLGNDVELWMGLQASEERLKGADLSSYTLLHFATHALVDSGSSNRGAADLAVVLAGSTGAQPGLLTVDEIEALDLHGKIVVLSTCDSASGPRIRGEGVMSLARSFFAAGARTVISSLKPLEDREAALLFTEFYRGLAAGSSVAEAMAQARRTRQKEGAPLSIWANVVVMGDGEIIPFPASTP